MEFDQLPFRCQGKHILIGESAQISPLLSSKLHPRSAYASAKFFLRFETDGVSSVPLVQTNVQSTN